MFGDLAQAALAFGIVTATLALVYALVRTARLLRDASELLQEAGPSGLESLERVSGLLDRLDGHCDRIDSLLDTATGTAESTDRAVRRVVDVVERPLGKVAGAGAFVSGAGSSFKARREERRRDDDVA